MPSMKHTTVVLSGKAQEIKEDLAPIFGLKNILSAGLILVGKLSSDEQKKLIAEANGTMLDVPTLESIGQVTIFQLMALCDAKQRKLDELEILRSKYSELTMAGQQNNAPGKKLERQIVYIKKDIYDIDNKMACIKLPDQDEPALKPQHPQQKYLGKSAIATKKHARQAKKPKSG